MQTPEFISINQLAQLSGKSCDVIRTRIIKGILPPPSTYRPNRILPRWKEAELPGLLKILGTQQIFESDVKHVRRREQGWFSLEEVAGQVGVARVTLEWWIKKKLFAKPSHKVDGFIGHYYTTEEANQIKQSYNEMKMNDYSDKLKKLATKHNVTSTEFLGKLIDAFEAFEKDAKKIKHKKAT